LLTQLASLQPDNVPVIRSEIPEHHEAITRLNAALSDWIKVKQKTWGSTAMTYLKRYPFSEEITDQIEGLSRSLEQEREDVSKKADLVSKDILFLNKTIDEKEKMDTTVIIKRFQSIDELLTYEDKLSQSAKGPAAQL